MAMVIAWAAWYTLTFIVISVVFLLIALAYMLGIGFHLPKLQGWAKEELYQAVASALLAVLLITLMSTINTTMQDLYGRDPFGIALDYINAMVGNLSTYLLSVMTVDVDIALLQSMAFKAMPSQLGFNINPFAGYAVLTSLLSMVMEFILGGMGLMVAQYTFIQFISQQLPIILPIGIALRSFPFSRAAGGALIAVFIGFYLFYPFLWVFDSAIYSQLSSWSAINSNISTNEQGLGSACVSNPVSCTTNTGESGSNILLSLFSGLSGSIGFGLAMHTVGLNSVIYEVIYYLFILVVLMSVFNLLTTLVLMNELAKILGSDIDLGGLSGLI